MPDTPGTLNFPASLDTAVSLFETANNKFATLQVPIDADDTTITVDLITGFPNSGAVTIGGEVIFYTGISGNSFTGCIRGSDGTTASTHPTATVVAMLFVAAHHRTLANGLIQVETKLGSGASVPITDKTVLMATGAGTSEWSTVPAAFGTGSVGQVTFWQDTNTVQGDAGFFWDNTNKRVGIGTSSPEKTIHALSDSQLDLALESYQNSSASPTILFRKSRGTTSSPSPVTLNDTLGVLGFFGYDGTGFNYATPANISVAAAETFTSSAHGNSMSFSTTTVGSATRALRLQIDSTGNVRVAGNLGAGLNFTPTAFVHIWAGSATNAPLKFTAGTNLTTPQNGTVEYTGRFFVTEGDNTRRYLVQATASTKVSGTPTTDGYVTIVINGTPIKVMTTA
jgi:hypothetical protein